MNEPSADANSQPPFFQFQSIGFAVFVVSLAVEGPIRLVLGALHVPFLIYIRDVLALATIAQVFYTKARENFTLVVFVTLLVLVHNIVGLWNMRLPQVLFGDKILLYGMYGACASAVICRRDPAMKTFLWAMLGVTMVGIFYNYFYNHPPWADVESDIGGLAQGGVHANYAGGVARLAGFTRSNTSAAGLLVFVTLSLIFISRNLIWQCCVVVASMPFIFLTNSKATSVCMLVAVLPYIFLRTRRDAVLKPLCVVAIALSMLVPLGFWGVTMHAPTADTFSLFSFADRVNRSWPNSWHLIGERGSVLLGRGIGGIGTPQKTFESAHFAEADNLFIYMYANFGALAVAYYAYAIYLVLKSSRRDQIDIEFAMVILVFAGFNGITAVTVEDQLILFYICAALAVLYRSHFVPYSLHGGPKTGLLGGEPAGA